MMNKISLEEAKKIKLFNRIDNKYDITFNQFCQLVEFISNNYYIVVNSKNEILLNYKSIYFDTYSYDMYNDHKNDTENRQKIRIREYENGDKFLEIKTKTKDKRTKKKRINIVSNNLVDYKNWIVDNLNYDYTKIKEKIEISFKRLTIISKDKNERITIDFGIKFNNYITGIKKNINNIIVEVKKENENLSP